jgi:hypothetical protein
MLTVNDVRAIPSFSTLSEVELERLALSAAGVHQQLGSQASEK